MTTFNRARPLATMGAPLPSGCRAAMRK